MFYVEYSEIIIEENHDSLIKNDIFKISSYVFLKIVNYSKHNIFLFRIKKSKLIM